jgi:hypothetical protein
VSDLTPTFFGLGEAVAYLERFNPAARNGKAEAEIRSAAQHMLENPETFACDTLGFHLCRQEAGTDFWVWVDPHLWAKAQAA